MTQHVQPIKVPKQRDFTGGFFPAKSRAFVGSTGEKDLDERLRELAVELAGSSRQDLLAEMLVSAVRIARGGVTVEDFKTMNRALREMRKANEVFYPYRDCRKVAVFGSARTSSDQPEYKAAVAFCEKMRDAGFMTITGAGGGIMAAGNEGAGKEDSFGLNINLPFEASANPFIAGDDKLIDFHFFFTRKLSFVKESDAVVAFPGGFGTMDEVFETITLIQTGKTRIYPLVLVDAKGGTYWRFWNQFVETHLKRLHLISESDFSLFKVTDDVDEAVEEIQRFYHNFHSYRYVGDHLIIRLQNRLSDKAMAVLERDFADVVKSGKFEQSDALPIEQEDEARLNSLSRLCFRHAQRDFGRLRQLIDTINALS